MPNSIFSLRLLRHGANLVWFAQRCLRSVAISRFHAAWTLPISLAFGFWVGGQCVWGQNADEAQLLLARALEAYEGQRFVEALEAFQQAQALAPSNPMPHFGLGLVYAGLGWPEQAIDAFQAALALKPDFAQAHQELGELYALQRQYAQAESHFRRAIDLNPQMTAAYAGLGRAFASQRNFADAVEQFQKAIALNPDSAVTHYNLGQTYGWTGALDQARSSYRQAIVLAPNLPDAHYELGIVEMRLRKYSDAVAAFETVLALAPRHKAAYHNLSRAYTKLGKPELAQAALQQFEELHRVDEALKPHKRALEANPTDLTARYALAQAYATHGWLDEAAAQCERLLALRPDHVPAYAIRLSIEVSQKRWDSASLWAKRLIKIRPDLALGYSYLGLSAAELGQVETAIEAYRKAIALEPETPSNYNNLAWFYATQNINLNEAVSLCQKAIALEPKATYLDTLAQIYFQLGRYQEALETIEAALRQEPDNPKYRERQQMIQQAAGEGLP